MWIVKTPPMPDHFFRMEDYKCEGEETRNEQNRFTLPVTQKIAQVRLERMETGLQWLTEESFGIL
jgi:hypothetical protein